MGRWGCGGGRVCRYLPHGLRACSEDRCVIPSTRGCGVHFTPHAAWACSWVWVRWGHLWPIPNTLSKWSCGFTLGFMLFTFHEAFGPCPSPNPFPPKAAACCCLGCEGGWGWVRVSLPCARAFACAHGCVHVGVCLHTRTCAQTCAQAHARTCACMCACLHMQVQQLAAVHACTGMCTCIHVHASMYACMHPHVCMHSEAVCADMQVHACMHAWVHACMYPCTHMHLHVHACRTKSCVHVHV